MVRVSLVDNQATYIRSRKSGDTWGKSILTIFLCVCGKTFYFSHVFSNYKCRAASYTLRNIGSFGQTAPPNSSWADNLVFRYLLYRVHIQKVHNLCFRVSYNIE